MGFSFTLTRNDISPALSKLARTARNPQKVFRAMGTTFMSITMGNFKIDPSYRPTSWPVKKKDGQPSFLMLHNVLSRSFHLEVSDTAAVVGTPVIYAAIHQFGAKGHVLGKKTGSVKTKYANPKFVGSWNDVMSGGHGIPPRPYFPVEGPPESSRLTAKAADKIKAAGERAMLRESQS